MGWTKNYDYVNMTIVLYARLLMKRIKAGEFKAKCLKLMDWVQKNREEIIITKHDKPIAKLVPLATTASRPLFGYLKGSVEIRGDIIGSTGESWEADEEN